MTFYHLASVAHFGAAPEGATILNLDDPSPFRGLSLHAEALAEVLRLHAARFGSGRGANLRGANLRWADLTGANLRWVDLTGANLRWADLTGANLTGADLTGAYLRWATLTGANLTGANLRGANLTGANLRGAYLRWATLTGADLTGADLRRAVSLASPEEEAANIAAAVEAIAAEPHHWNQAVWHGNGFDPAAAAAVGSCGTAHCLAGWLQTLLPIGDERRKLDPESCGWALAPRAAEAGWFASDTHPDLQARVDAAIAKRNASPA